MWGLNSPLCPAAPRGALPSSAQRGGPCAGRGPIPASPSPATTEDLGDPLPLTPAPSGHLVPITSSPRGAIPTGATWWQHICTDHIPSLHSGGATGPCRPVRLRKQGPEQDIRGTWFLRRLLPPHLEASNKAARHCPARPSPTPSPQGPARPLLSLLSTPHQRVLAQPEISAEESKHPISWPRHARKARIFAKPATTGRVRRESWEMWEACRACPVQNPLFLPLAPLPGLCFTKGEKTKHQKAGFHQKSIP